MDNNDLYMIYLNSSNIGLSNSGLPILATEDSDFTTTIRPLNLSQSSNWVVGVVDVNYYNLDNNPSVPAGTKEYPINIYSDVGIQVRNGGGTTDLLYTTAPPINVTPKPLYFGEKNTSSIIGWRPIQNKSIQKINMRFVTPTGEECMWDGTGTRGFNSITLAIMKVQ
tara:strand:- start:2197 stop:2697 length:501 start_codon:yes stop_codon:yes gene_type:complete